jgi:DNA-binding response OmpR family regulator
MEPYTLLIIARSQSLAKRLRSTLDSEQYLIRWVPSTVQALQLDLHPSLLILDLPPSGGARSVIRLRCHFDAPLIALSGSDQALPEQVDALLSRPYRVAELVALIEVTLINHSPHMIHAAGMSLDREGRRLQVNGAVYQLPPTGCQILASLMAQAGQVVPRDELFRSVWRTEEGDSTRALDVHIAQLRRQIEVDPRRPKLILTERGVGYRLQPPARLP